MLCIYRIVFALALLAECNRLVTSMMVGPSKLDEGRSDSSNGMNLLLGDEQSDDLAQSIMTPKRLLVQDKHLGDEDGATRILILSDKGPGGFSARPQQLSDALGRAFPLLATRSLDLAAANWMPREPDDNLPALRRDLDSERDSLLRCMIGRVYRPCWQV